MIWLPARMGLLNRRALIRQMERAGTASRAELARALGMSQPTAGKIVDDLLAEGVLEEVVEVAGRARGVVAPGRPGRRLGLNRGRPGILGIQLGVAGTELHELALGGGGRVLWQHRFAHAAREPGRAWAAGLRRAGRQLPGGPVRCVVLSVPGVVDEAAQRILFSPNIHWSEGLDLAGMVRSVWKAPVLMVQEERVLARGHQRQHPEQEDFLLVDFGDGVGGAILVGGKLFAGPLPISGELGHTPVPGNRRLCGCGATGCVETLVSARGLLESFRQAQPGGRGDWAALQKRVATHGVEPWLAAALAAAAVVIAGALNVLGLRRVVVTGILTELAPEVMARLTEAVRRGVMWGRFGEVECVAAPRQRLAGLVAAGIDRFIAAESGAAGQPGAGILTT